MAYSNFHMNHWILATLILSLVSPIFYTRSILAGKAKPHRVTRLIVWLASITGILGVLHSTNLAGIIFAVIFLTRATYLLILSWLRGVGGASRLDRTCLGIGLLALAGYVVTGSGLVAISLGILSDLIGYIPTFVKTWHKPESEDPTFFIIEGIASLLGVIAIRQFRVDILFPLYFVLCSAVVVALIYRRKLGRAFRIRGATPMDSPQ